MDVVREDMSRQDALDALVANKIKALIIIPAHFERDLKLSHAPTIALGVDNSYFLIYGAVLEASMKSIMQEAGGVKAAKLLVQQVPMQSVKKEISPFSLNVINLFNRYSSYTEYVIPAVFVLILQQTLLIGMGILGGGINERMRRREDGYYMRAKVSQMIASRYLIFGGLFFMHMLYYFGFSFTFFDITHLADIGTLLAFGTLFLTASLSLGLFLGALFSEREIATPTVLFSSLPLVFSAGFVWPKEAIPAYIYDIALFIPSTPAIDGFLKINQFGAELSAVSTNALILLTQTVVYTILGYYFMKKNQKAYNGKI
jgi:ABC-2 type transport system permease protein